MFTARLALSCLLATLATVAHGAVTGSLDVQANGPFTGSFDDVKVPVVLGVMSRCPDAVLCETVFDHVLERVVDKIDLSLTFIGK